MDDTIKAILYSWYEKKIPSILPRDINLENYIDIKPRKIIAITGFRRTGKTFLLLDLLNKLLENKNRKQEVYINFDDERIPQKTEFLTDLIPSIKQIFQEEIIHLFLDEIQNMPDWSRWLRRIQDNEAFQIFITGSSSKVSSKEIPTELRGRCLEIKIFPLSFKEFLKFKNIKINKETLKYSENEKTKTVKAFDEYLKYGGMPEVVLATEDKKSEFLQQYYGTVVRRDIVERYNVQNEEGLKAMMRLLLNSTQYSISQLYKTMKSLNYEIGKTTILNYLNYVESSYFTYSLPIISKKVKDQLQYPRKVYFIDNGFINTLSTRYTKNNGRLFENIVAIDLLRKYSQNNNIELYYWKDRTGKEVDFVIKEDLKIKQLIQVCYDVEYYDTKKREIDALVKAGDELKCKNLMIITKDYEETEQIKNKEIKFIPLTKWLL
ncbi:MAG: ATP-binding protein [Candidatus Thermoplasmatota archaeon]|nr:ATP-binding protein [Candidatus Thermoplasmatota archaeon]